MANIPEETDEANETKTFQQKMNIENIFQIQNLNDDIVNIPVSISPATLINMMDVNQQLSSSDLEIEAEREKRLEIFKEQYFK